MKPNCPYCDVDPDGRPVTRTATRFGRFRRTSDCKLVQRFICGSCRKTFSLATFDDCYRQKKRSVNTPLMRALNSGISERRCAKNLSINRKTVVRKILFLAECARRQIEASHRASDKALCIEFDDLETSEHTKLKPLAVSVAVETGTRRILGLTVARMPAKGPRAKFARAKYGPRPDERPTARRKLFEELGPLIERTATIKSDELSHYTRDIKRAFPSAEHQKFKGRKPRFAGLGELKKIGFDPLFSINHTFAMLRANINRLFRKTWCTTKRPDRLEARLWIYTAYHNSDLINKSLQPR